MQEDPSRHFQLLLRKRVALEIFQALARFFAGDLPRMLDTSAPFLQRYSLLQSKQRLSVVYVSQMLDTSAPSLQRYSLLQSKQRLSVVYVWLDGIEQLQNFHQRLENLPEGAVAVEHAT